MNIREQIQSGVGDLFAGGFKGRKPGSKSLKGLNPTGVLNAAKKMWGDGGDFNIHMERAMRDECPHITGAISFDKLTRTQQSNVAKTMYGKSQQKVRATRLKTKVQAGGPGSGRHKEADAMSTRDKKQARLQEGIAKIKEAHKESKPLKEAWHKGLRLKEKLGKEYSKQLQKHDDEEYPLHPDLKRAEQRFKAQDRVIDKQDRDHSRAIYKIMRIADKYGLRHGISGYEDKRGKRWK